MSPARGTRFADVSPKRSRGWDVVRSLELAEAAMSAEKPSELDAAPSVPLDKVEWRVDSEPYERNGKYTCRFVPYVDAVLVASLMDEWVGPFRWRDRYESGTVDGKPAMWGRVAVKVDGEWVEKEDIGVPSNMEGPKGAVSDAFKRVACRKWGVARNVYEMPTVYAHCRTYTSKGQTKAADDGKATLDDIAKKLTALGYEASGGRLRDHESEQVAEEAAATAPPPAPTTSTPRPFDLPAFLKTCEDQGRDPLDVLAHAEIRKPLEELTEADRDALKASLAALAAGVSESLSVKDATGVSA